MRTVFPCPTCFSPQDPDARECLLCGQDFVPTKPAPAEPVSHTAVTIELRQAPTGVRISRLYRRY